MARSARISGFFTTMVGCVGCDQVAKTAARLQLHPGTTVSLFHDVIRLQHVENPGAFLSMGDSLPGSVRLILFTIGGVVLVCAAIFWALHTRRSNSLESLGATLICSGGLGNLIDRLMQGGNVTDFLNLGCGPLRTGIFNIADFLLLIGISLVVLGGASFRAGRAA